MWGGRGWGVQYATKNIGWWPPPDVFCFQHCHPQTAVFCNLTLLKNAKNIAWGVRKKFNVVDFSNLAAHIIELLKVSTWILFTETFVSFFNEVLARGYIKLEWHHIAQTTIVPGYIFFTEKSKSDFQRSFITQVRKFLFQWRNLIYFMFVKSKSLIFKTSYSVLSVDV